MASLQAGCSVAVANRLKDLETSVRFYWSSCRNHSAGVRVQALRTCGKVQISNVTD